MWVLLVDRQRLQEKFPITRIRGVRFVEDAEGNLVPYRACQYFERPGVEDNLNFKGYEFRRARPNRYEMQNKDVEESGFKLSRSGNRYDIDRIALGFGYEAPKLQAARVASFVARIQDAALEGVEGPLTAARLKALEGRKL